MHASTSPGNDYHRWRFSVYVLVAVAALFTGYILGLLGGRLSGDSRPGEPPPPTNPRSLYS